MTHLSDFSYLERLGFNILNLFFFLFYAFIANRCLRDVSWEHLRSYNFRGLCVLLYTTALVTIIVSDVTTSYIKYNTGFHDSCLDCGEFVNGSATCVELQDCAGIITMPRELWPQWAVNLLPVADLFWNLSCTLRTSAIFLMMTCFNYALPKSRSRALFQKVEVQLFSAYAACSVILYLLMQYVFFTDKLLATIVPQLFYSAELLVAAGLLIHTNRRIVNLLQRMSRNFAVPGENEATLMYISTMNKILVAMLFLNAIGLGTINVDIVVHHPEAGPAYESKFWTDVFTRILNLGYVLEPVVVVLILYKPRFAVGTFHVRKGSAPGNSKKQSVSSMMRIEEEPTALKRTTSLDSATLAKHKVFDVLPVLRHTQWTNKDTIKLMTEGNLTPRTKQAQLSKSSINMSSSTDDGVATLESQSHSDDSETLLPTLHRTATIDTAGLAAIELALMDKDDEGKEPVINEEDQTAGDGAADEEKEITKNVERFWKVSKHMQDVEDAVHGSALSKEERLELSRLWVSDALMNREVKLHRIKGLPVRVYRFANNVYWRYVLLVTVFVQLVVLPFMEPASTFHGSAIPDNYLAALVVDFFCCLILIFDAFLVLYTYGLKEMQVGYSPKALLQSQWSMKSKLLHARILILIIMFINLIVAFADRSAFRLDRILRPAMVLFVSPAVLNLVQDLVLTFFDFLGVVLFYSFAIAWFSIVGSFVIDAEAYKQVRDDDFGLGENTTEPQAEELFSFENPPALSLNLFVLSELETYPDIFLPAFSSQPVLSSMFFLAFIIFSILFLQSIAVPLVYLPFQRRQRKRLLQSKIAERKALVAAFEVLDVRQEEKLALPLVAELLESFAAREHINVLLQIMDEDADGSIDLLEFFKIVDTIKLNIKVSVVKDEIPYWSFCGFHVNKKHAQVTVRSKWFRIIGNVLCTCAAVALFLYNVISIRAVLAAVGLFLLFLAVERVLLILSQSEKASKRRVIRTVCLAIEIILYIAVVVMPAEMVHRSAVMGALAILLLTVHVAQRVAREVNLVAQIIFVSFKMTHILSVLLVVIFLLMYLYTVIGMEAFSGSNFSTIPSGENDFADFDHAWFSVFQMVTGENWNVLLYIQLVDSPSFLWRGFVIFFFVSFNVVLNLYILSIVLAIFLDAFLVFQNVKEDTIQVVYDNDKAAKTLGLPKKRYVLIKQRSLEETLYEEFLQDNDLSTIEELFKRGIICESTNTATKEKLAKEKKRRKLARFISNKMDMRNHVLRASDFGEISKQKHNLEGDATHAAEFAALFDD